MREELFEIFDGRPRAARTRGLSKRFGATTALAGLELAVPEGAVYVLVGPNGAGKTTTLRTLLDLTAPDEGHAEVFGLPGAARGAEVRARIGYVPESQEFHYGDLSVAALLGHHAAYFPAWDPGYADRLCGALEIDARQRFGKLSKGQARRVQLVLALAHRPPLLLMDEPTDGLDPLAQDRFLELLAEHLAETPTTVLVSTHRVHEVEGIGDCLGVLRDGRLVAQLDRQRLERRLQRAGFEVPEGWREPATLAERVLRRRDRGRERSWVVWGEPDRLATELAAAGATLRQLEPLNLEESTRALLAMEEGR